MTLILQPLMFIIWAEYSDRFLIISGFFWSCMVGLEGLIRFRLIASAIIKWWQTSANTVNPVIYPENTRATENVRLHYGRNRLGHFARSNFEWVEREGDLNIYEGTWIVRQFRGMHHAVIDVIDNGTIYEESETDYPYISNTWATPYRVTVF